jgi:hypothetical protein
MIKDLLDFQLIDIVSIQSPIAEFHFSPDEIEKLAHNFLAAGGNIHPLLVKRLSPEEFEVVEGHLEFYAAKRAREINKYFEMIRAIILNDKNRKSVLEQLNFIQHQDLSQNIPSGTISSPMIPNDETDALTASFTQLFTNLEKNILRGVDDLRERVKENSRAINQLQDYHEGIRDQRSFLDKFNQDSPYELASELSKKGVYKDTEAPSVANLVVAERQNGEFTSLVDVVNRVRKPGKQRHKAITQERMIKLLDSWSRP